MRLPFREACGFTLLELTAVICIIGIIAALSFPQFLPVIAFSQLEGDARHLANYGRSAVAQAMLTRTDLTVYVDLNAEDEEGNLAQEYWAVQLVYPSEQETEGESGPNQWEMMREMRGQMPGGEFRSLLSKSRQGGGELTGMPEGFDDSEANADMASRFERFARRGVAARAKNVIPDEGFLEEVGSLFEDDEKEFALTLEEPEEMELMDPILARTGLAKDVRIESVEVDGKTFTRGQVEILISAVGLQQLVVFYVVNEEEEYYTVVWDPLTGGSRVYEGRESIV